MNYFIKNIFLFLFFGAAILYGYTNSIENHQLIFITKFFLVPSMLFHYIITSKTKNYFYIIALIMATFGDLLFSGITFEYKMISICCFTLYNLFIIYISFEKNGLFDFSKVTLSTLPFFAIFLSIFLYLFNDNVTYEIYLIIIYFITLAFLTSFSLYYVLKTKSKVSLYFLIGSVLLFIANISKGFEDLKSATYIIKIINISAYAFSHFFYYKAVVFEEKK